MWIYGVWCTQEKEIRNLGKGLSVTYGTKRLHLLTSIFLLKDLGMPIKWACILSPYICSYLGKKLSQQMYQFWHQCLANIYSADNEATREILLAHQQKILILKSKWANNKPIKTMVLLKFCLKGIKNRCSAQHFFAKASCFCVVVPHFFLAGEKKSLSGCFISISDFFVKWAIKVTLFASSEAACLSMGSVELSKHLLVFQHAINCQWNLSQKSKCQETKISAGIFSLFLFKHTSPHSTSLFISCYNLLLGELALDMLPPH